MVEKLTLPSNAKSLSNAFKGFSEKISPVVRKIDVDDFNNFFVQVGQSHATDTPCNFTTAGIEATEKSFFFWPTDESEVSIDIEKLKNKRSDSHDGINNRLVKFCAPIILPFLNFGFNQCLNAGVFPDICKIAKVLPFDKTGKQTEPKNFRPLNLLSTFSEIFEKVLHIRMIKFISKSK